MSVMTYAFPPRLVPIELEPQPRRRAEAQDSAAPLLFIGFIASLYVAARIGLAYALLSH